MSDKLTPEEKGILKTQLREAFDEFPDELKHRILETKKDRLRTLYMILGWAKNNGHETIVDLLARKISHKEEKIADLERQLKE